MTQNKRCRNAPTVAEKGKKVSRSAEDGSFYFKARMMYESADGTGLMPSPQHRDRCARNRRYAVVVVVAAAVTNPAPTQD